MIVPRIVKNKICFSGNRMHHYSYHNSAPLDHILHQRNSLRLLRPVSSSFFFTVSSHLSHQVVSVQQYSCLTSAGLCYLSHSCYMQWSSCVIHYLSKSLRTPTRNCSPIFLWHTSQSWTLILGGPTLWLYESSNSAREAFCLVFERLWWNGSPFFLQSCSQSS
jgi:hypothetical protein